MSFQQLEMFLSLVDLRHWVGQPFGRRFSHCKPLAKRRNYLNECGEAALKSYLCCSACTALSIFPHTTSPIFSEAFWLINFSTCSPENDQNIHWNALNVILVELRCKLILWPTRKTNHSGKVQVWTVTGLCTRGFLLKLGSLQTWIKTSMEADRGVIPLSVA